MNVHPSDKLLKSFPFTLLVLSQGFPPSVGGTPTVLANLFSQFSPGEFTVIRGIPNKIFDTDWPRSIQEAENHVVSSPYWMSRFRFSKFKFFYWIEWYWMKKRVNVAIKLFHRKHYTAILGIIPGPEFASSAYLIQKATHLPLYMYYLDSTQPYPGEEPWRRRMLNNYEKLWLRSAREVFVLSEGLTQDLKNRLGVNRYVLLRHSLRPEILDQDLSTERPVKDSREKRIIYIGNFRPVQDVNTLNLVVNILEEIQNIHFEFFTGQTREQLVAGGLKDSPVWSCIHYSNQQILAEERNADLIIVSLDHNSPLQPLLRTLFPTKTVESMVSGVPILVIAPADTYTAQYARSAGFAYVVSAFRQEAIREAILRLLTDDKLRQKLILQAGKTAQANHDVRQIGKIFRQKILLDANGKSNFLQASECDDNYYFSN